MLIRLRKAQSTAEYAVILGVVVAAVLAMQVYIKRGIQARAKSGVDALTQPEFSMTEGGATADFVSQRQYEPYYVESTYDNYQASRGEVAVDANYNATTEGEEVSARGDGGYQTQHGVAGRGSYEGLFEE